MFSWISTYQQIAQQLLPYEHRQSELFAVLEELGIVSSETTGAAQIDGFTFLRYLNRSGKGNRLALLKKLCKRWGISPLPEDLDGLPDVPPLHIEMYPAAAQGNGKEVQRLWTFFKAIRNDAITEKLFREMLSINGLGKVKLTEAMYLLRPDLYLPLNQTVKAFLQSARLIADFNNLSEYRQATQKVKEVFNRSFPELVKEAYEYLPQVHTDVVSEDEAHYRPTPPVISSQAPLNVILYGPPGTGKTYQAIDKAVQIADPDFYVENRSDRTTLTERFNELLIKDYDKATGQIGFCTFHQSMSYEDFVEGIKPRMEADAAELQYRVQDGIFKVMTRLAVKGAKKKTPQQYVLIIDEINRGNVSAILGELITLIEDNKRQGKSEALTVTLPYSKKPFCVPANLHIIGTMNTADRSVETLDTALRRRFVFEEVVAQPHLLSPQQLLSRFYAQYDAASWQDDAFRKRVEALYQLIGIDPTFEFSIRDSNGDIDSEKISLLKEAQFTGVHLEKLLAAINKRLSVLLSADHTIGHAWLMEVYSLADLQTVFKHKILPLLQEYFFNNYAKIGLVLGNAFVKGEPVHRGVFATFTDAAETANEYTDTIKYTLTDASQLLLKAFSSIYQ